MPSVSNGFRRLRLIPPGSDPVSRYVRDQVVGSLSRHAAGRGNDGGEGRSRTGSSEPPPKPQHRPSTGT